MPFLAAMRRQDVAFLRRDLADVVVAHEAGCGREAARDGVEPVVCRRDDGLHGAVVAQVAHERARVDALDGDDAAALEELGQRLRGTEVAGLIAHVAHDEALRVDLAPLHVLGVHAVVANLGVGHRDDLAGVGRVADDLLVAGQRGVEHELAEGLPFRAARVAMEDGSVFEQQDRWFSFAERHF